jgi:hypothetical protein
MKVSLTIVLSCLILNCIQAFPSPRLTMTRWWLKTSDPVDFKSIYAPTAYALSKLPSLSREAGVQGYFYTYPNETWFLIFTADKHSGIDAAKKTWAPILEKLAYFPGVKPPVYMYNNFPNFKSMFDTLFGPLEEVATAQHHLSAQADIRRFRRSVEELEEAFPRGIIPMDSRLLGEPHLSNPGLKVALRDSMPKVEYGMLRGHLTAGGAVLETPVEATSVNPAWRKAWIHLIGTGVGVPDVKALKEFAPDSGCYANEVMSCGTGQSDSN